VTFRGAVLLLFCITAGIAAQEYNEFRLPDPEEVYQAYQDGFLEYEGYRQLLEICRSGPVNGEDSLFVRYFAHVLQGLDFDPLLSDEETLPDTSTTTPQLPYHHSSLYRQYHRLKDDNDINRLWRHEATCGTVSTYFEIEKEYSGLTRWGRRYLSYSCELNSGNKVDLTVGNFNRSFGLGVIYGYHGRLLDKDEELSTADWFLSPNYGGSNGVWASFKHGARMYDAVFDFDRNDTHRKEMSGLSLPVPLTATDLILSFVYGRLVNREAGAKTEAGLTSLFNRGRLLSGSYEAEIALASNNNDWHMALAGEWRRVKNRSSLSIVGWHYDRGYPSWFAGGPSRRSYRTVEIDELEFSYRDRFAGESGGVIKTSSALSSTVKFQNAFSYAWRSADDNRLEYRSAVKYRFNPAYAVEVRWHYRSDDALYDENRRQRIYATLVRQAGQLRMKGGLGYYFDSDSERDDYLVYLEGRFDHRAGRFWLMAKWDRLEWSALRNNYFYTTVAYEADLGCGLSTYIKYSYRYRRDSAASTYGVLRWDISWRI